MRKTILTVYGAVFALGILYAIWIALTGLSLPCMYRATTGMLCPGCGLTTMMLCLVRGDVIGAFGCNPVVFVLLIVWNGLALLGLTEMIGTLRDKRFWYAALGVTVAILAVWSIVRNTA